MYFLKKIHKNPMGVRPICSASSGPTEGLSKIVETILQPIVPTLPSFVKDSGHFCKIIEETLIPDDAILVALDVKSLYPSIPKEDAISAGKKATEKFYEIDNDAPVIVETFLIGGDPQTGAADGTQTNIAFADYSLFQLTSYFCNHR